MLVKNGDESHGIEYIESVKNLQKNKHKYLTKGMNIIIAKKELYIYLPCGFNPFENYARQIGSNWIMKPQGSGWK